MGIAQDFWAIIRQEARKKEPQAHIEDSHSPRRSERDREGIPYAFSKGPRSRREP